MVLNSPILCFTIVFSLFAVFNIYLNSKINTEESIVEEKFYRKPLTSRIKKDGNIKSLFVNYILLFLYISNMAVAYRIVFQTSESILSNIILINFAFLIFCLIFYDIYNRIKPNSGIHMDENFISKIQNGQVKSRRAFFEIDKLEEESGKLIIHSTDYIESEMELENYNEDIVETLKSNIVLHNIT
jgi:hypothetical protein